jgi:hypothetical protein
MLNLTIYYNTTIVRPLYYLLILGLLFFQSCELPQKPEKPTQDPVLDKYNSTTNSSDLLYRDTVYIPIYSEIYSETKDVKFNLTATLSIRNTSLVDTIYIDDIDYYNTEGKLVRHYLVEQTLGLSPMQSIEYVIEEEDTEGGTGANFIINWAANNKHVNPLFQGVMISTNGQQGISFLTEGVSIRKK